MTDEYGTDAEVRATAADGVTAADDGDAISDVTSEAEAQLEGLQQDLEALNERHLRLAAEFDNYRKRIERERTELYARAQADLIKRLLDVVDDIQRVAAVDVANTTTETLHEGIVIVEKKLRHMLASAGLEVIEAEGEFFNPATMEALATVETDRPEEDEMVADVFQKGYRFHDHLIRPARVRVKKYGQL